MKNLTSKNLQLNEGRHTGRDSRLSAKPSPAREGWVRGNQNKENAYLYPPHPNLLPEGEGAHILKSTVLPTIPYQGNPCRNGGYRACVANWLRILSNQVISHHE